MTEDNAPNIRKKRVRFRDDDEVRHYEPDSPKRAHAVRQGLAPPAAESPAEPACARRAALADLFLPEGEEGEGPGAAPADADVDWDVLHPSEADYEDPSELLNDGGVPFEPFNLKAEREEGYFDRESGSYVRMRRREAVDDAWADALAATEVDAGWAAAVLGGRRRGAAGADAGVEEGAEADAAAVARLKNRIVGLLRPGENVLAALRRLGRARADSAGAAAPSVVRGRVGLTPEARSDFDRLTEASAALMEAGEYMAHSLSREALVGVGASEGGGGGVGGAERQAEVLLKAAARGEAGSAEEAPAAAAMAVPAPAPAAPADEDVDMFAADGDGGKEITAEKHGEAGTAASEAPADTPADAPASGDAPLQGFVLDASTGYFYNSAMRAYYDPRSRLFGDAASGTWWRLDAATGQYVAA